MNKTIITDSVLDEYLQYLELECGLSQNSLDAYRRDINEFKRVFKLSDDFNVRLKTVNEYIAGLSDLNRKPASIARKISSLRGFYKYLHEHDLVRENPFEFARVPRISRYHPDYLTIEEIERILAQPDSKANPGIRDIAILEMLYGTGMRISESIDLKLSAVYDEIGFIKILGKGGRERLVPYGTQARLATEKYLTGMREKIRETAQTDILFLSNRGGKFSRVGLWKIIKKYA